MKNGAMNHLNATLSVSDTFPFAGEFPSALPRGDEGPEEGLLMPEWGYTITAIILFLIGFFGFFFNLIVIVLMYKDIQLWTPINIILLNLVCSDFSVSILGNPFTFASAIYRRWIFGQSMCVLYGYFMSLLGITSITTLTVLSYERFCLVCRPLSTRQAHNHNSYWTVMFIWTYSILLTTPPIFGWGQYVVEVPNVSCSVNWNSHEANATSYIIYLFIFGLIVPMAVILYSYINIIRTMKKNNFRMGRVNKAESKVTMMIGVMIILFMVAWTPYSVFALLEQFGPGVSSSLAVMPALLAKSSICYNPIIYVGMNSQYRAAWNRFWSGSGEEDGLKSGLDTTVNKISSKISIEFEVLKRKQAKCQVAHNMTVVEEVSVAENTVTTNNNNSNGNLSLKKNSSSTNINNGVVVQQPHGVTITNKCTAATLQKTLGDNAVGEPEEHNKESATKQRLIVDLCDNVNSGANQLSCQV